MQRGHASRPTVRLGEVHMPLQGQALKTVARPRADEHPLETCGLLTLTKSEEGRAEDSLPFAVRHSR